jgi:hypothetical protein
VPSLKQSAPRRPHFWLVLVLWVLVGLLGWWTLSLASPFNIVELEFAGTAARANKLLGNLAMSGDTSVELVRWSVVVDFLFAVSYGLALVASCVWATTRFYSVGVRATGYVVAWGAAAAVGLDWIENVALLAMLDGSADAWSARIAIAAAIPKFILIGMATAYFSLGLVLALFGRDTWSLIKSPKGRGSGIRITADARQEQSFPERVTESLLVDVSTIPSGVRQESSSGPDRAARIATGGLVAPPSVGRLHPAERAQAPDPLDTYLPAGVLDRVLAGEHLNRGVGVWAAVCEKDERASLKRILKTYGKEADTKLVATIQVMREPARPDPNDNTSHSAQRHRTAAIRALRKFLEDRDKPDLSDGVADTRGGDV